MRRGPRTIRRFCRFSAALVMACTLVPAAGALGDDWVVRPVRLGNSYSPFENADILLTPSGPAVGYTLFSDSHLYLSYLQTGQEFFDHRVGPSTASSATFATDPAGNVVFAARAGASIRTGTDATGWGIGIVDGVASTTLGTRTGLPVVAVNSHGVPAYAGVDLSNNRTFSSFDVPSAQWIDQAFPSGLLSSPFFQEALAYTPDDRAVMAYFTATSSPSGLSVNIQSGPGTWARYALSSNAVYTRGVSLATAPDGRVGVAYVSTSGVQISIFDGTTWATQTIPTGGALITLAPHSLAVNADGNFALAFVPATTSATGKVRLLTLDSGGTWSTDVLPVVARHASLAFDSANHPYVAAYDGYNVILASTNITAMLANDLNLDGVVNSDDVVPFVQAVQHPADYLAAHTPLTSADVAAIADRSQDLKVNVVDARLFADSMTANPVPGLASRNAAIYAFDQANLDPAIGSGNSNFFGTVISTGKAYVIGDSRGDLNDIGNTGVGDGVINYIDIDALRGALASSPSNLRFDLNGDGVVDAADVHVLIDNIMGTREGDANTDGKINADDYALVDRGFAKGLGGWENGDFNGDGVVDSADYLLLDTGYLLTNQQTPSPAFLAEREAEFGPAYVSELLAAIPEPAGVSLVVIMLPLLSRRRPR